LGTNLNKKKENRTQVLRWINGIEEDLGAEADQKADLGPDRDQGLEAEVAAEIETEQRNTIKETIALGRRELGVVPGVLQQEGIAAQDAFMTIKIIETEVETTTIPPSTTMPITSVIFTIIRDQGNKITFVVADNVVGDETVRAAKG